jgi:peroxiredoxin
MTASTIAEAVQEALVMDAPLSARLASFVGALRDLGSPYAEAYDRLVARLVSGEAGAPAPKPGDPMPPFVLPSDLGTLVSLEELLGQGPVVVSFNRGHWCPLCRLELAALARIHEKAEAVGAQIVSIVPERQPFAQKIKTDFKVPFPVLSDIDNAYALSLGLVMWVGEEVRGLYSSDGVNVPELNGGGGWFLPIPATFVVGRDGRVIARFVDADFRKRMEVEAILAALGSAVS